MLMSAMGDKLAKFKDACGFDPIEQLGTLTAGVKGAKGDQDATIVVTGFAKDKVVDCLLRPSEVDQSPIRRLASSWLTILPASACSSPRSTFETK